MARHRARDPFPGPLQEFVESEWPQVAGECLQHYGCYGKGYGAACVPRDGEYCGQASGVTADDPGMLARAKAADAYVRWRLARASWLGKDHPGWLMEILGAGEAHRIRYG